MNEEQNTTQIDEVVVLSKFEGDPIPENEFERIHIKNGEIIARETIENGEVVSTEQIKEVN